MCAWLQVDLARGNRVKAKQTYEKILGKALRGYGPSEHWAHAEYAYLLWDEGDRAGAHIHTPPTHLARLPERTIRFCWALCALRRPKGMRAVAVRVYNASNQALNARRGVAAGAMQHLHMALEVASLPEAIAEPADVASYSFRLGKMLWELPSAKECATRHAPSTPPGRPRLMFRQALCFVFWWDGGLVR